MLKGIDMTDYEPKMCSEFGDNNNERLRINKNIEPENCFKYKWFQKSIKNLN